MQNQAIEVLKQIDQHCEQSAIADESYMKAWQDGLVPFLGAITRIRQIRRVASAAVQRDPVAPPVAGCTAQSRRVPLHRGSQPPSLP